MLKDKRGYSELTFDKNQIHNFDRVGEIIVSIHDNGDGISPRILPDIFGKFISGTGMGTGLGLYISKNIIEAHGGKMWVSKNEPEFGTEEPNGATLCFSLPVSK